MKLIIQIPCLDEAESLPATIADLPRRVEGFDSVELLVVDDGSTDGTADVARALGVDHVVRLHGHQGLARAFMAGLSAAVAGGADVVVNTDADHQYRGEDIPALVGPILRGEVDMVIGARPIRELAHFSTTKRLLQALGSRVVRALSGVDVRDAPSGFRALTRDAALRLNVFNHFTYTIETVLQSGLSNLRVVSVPIRVNGPTRPSRLFASNVSYVLRGVRTIVCVYLTYRPARAFGALSATCLGAGLLLGLRYLVLMGVGQGRGHVQSVIACATLSLSGVFLAALGFLAYLAGINRRLLEEIVYLGRATRFRDRDAEPARARSSPAEVGSPQGRRGDDRPAGRLNEVRLRNELTNNSC